MILEPPSWSTVELDAMRIGLGFVVFRRFSTMRLLRPTEDLPHPVGIARVIDLRGATSPLVAPWIRYAAYVATLCYAAGVLVPLALPLLTAVVVADLTLRLSQGAVNHGHHLLAVVLTAQTAATALWIAADHWSWHLSLLQESRDSTVVWWTVQAILAVYFTSGLSKLLNTRAHWIQRSPMLLMSAYSRLDTDRMNNEVSWRASDRAIAPIFWLFERPKIAQGVFAAGLLVELVAPIGLLGKTVLTFTGLGLIGLHRGNTLLLGLSFTEFQLLVLIYLVNVPQLLR
jgi:hypothetical protein